MAFDSWGVLPDLEEHEFVLGFGNSSGDPAKPFLTLSNPMSETNIRAKLKENGKADEEADSAIAKAKAKWKVDNPRV